MLFQSKKVLIIRFSSIGDIVLTSAVVRCLKAQIPGIEIHYLTKKQFQPVLGANPAIDRIWEYDNNFRNLIPELKAQQFDFIVDLHKNLRSHYVKFKLGVKSASFPKLNFRKWLMVHFKVNFLPDIHIVDRYFRAVAKPGIANDGLGLDYYISEKDEVDINLLPMSHQNGYTAVVIGGKHNTKIFPVEKVIGVCRKLDEPVLILGGTEDRARGDEIARQVGHLVINGCGKYSINQSASLIRQANAVLSNDTGMMHIAAAFKKPVVSVWGNTIPAFGMYPYLPETYKSNSMIAEVTGLSCRPCSKLGYDACPKTHFRCMQDIDEQAIVTFLKGKIGTRDAGQRIVTRDA